MFYYCVTNQRIKIKINYLSELLILFELLLIFSQKIADNF